MSARGVSSGMHWAVAALGAAVVLAAMLLLFRGPEIAPVPTVAPKGPIVRFVKPDGKDAALDEEAIMGDTTPLFLPTALNATMPAQLRREAGNALLDRETTRFSFSETGLSLARDLPPAVTLNGKPLAEASPNDALSASAAGGPMLLGLGRVDLPRTSLPKRGAFIEIVAANTGRQVLAQALPLEARPPTERAWQPIEFLAAVEAAGLVRPPVVIEGSRVEEVDAHFRKYLAQRFRIGERLPPGFYRIVVGP